MQGTVITNKGLQLIAKLVASGTALSFTRAAVGTGSVPSGYDPTNMTSLNKYKMNGAIASCSSSGDTASIIFQISSIGVSAGFTITEAGLFATDPDEGEILYCYLDMSSDPQYIYAEGSAISKFVEMTLTVVIGSVQSVTAYINPGSLLTNDGDISNTEIGTLDNITESFPVPVAKEKSSKFLGKVKKSFEDWKNLKASLLLISSIINNCVTDNPSRPLSAAQGKVLMDMLIKQNSDIATKASVSSMTALENRLPSGCAFVYKSFLIPKQDIETGIFDVGAYIPSSARWASVCAANGTNTPLVISTIKGVENRWKIYTKDVSLGNFTVTAIYII